MEHQQKNLTAAVICTLLSVFCLLFYYLGMSQKQGLNRYDNCITLLHSDENVCFYPKAVQMRASNQETDSPFSYSLWGSGGVRLLQNPDLERSKEVEILVVEGSSDLLVSASVILDGTVEKAA